MPAKDQGSLATQANKLQRADESQEFQESYGESFANTLDLNTWTPGEDLLAAYARLDQEVGEALAREDEYRSWQDHDGSPTRGCLLQGPRSDGGRDGKGLR